ncbi:hypothetical protein [Colwellia sp. 75C3]|uniref:hypothetical protein n=1 Tax=Colwellia sp. 75C3 TaxID=888425 RepID=UPI000C337733|nr:hypothetical protein [Colwellia sp. 75C3]
MNIIKSLKPWTFIFLASSYIFFFFGSIYGLFVSELSVKFGANPQYHYVLSGWHKNSLCLSLLLILAALGVYPILRGLYLALSNSH